jgi:hypothetical protein
LQLLQDSDYEQTGPGLRQEINRVDHYSAKAVTSVRESDPYRREVIAATRVECAADIFERYETRRPSFPFQMEDQFPEWPERARTLSPETSAISSQR